MCTLSEQAEAISCTMFQAKSNTRKATSLIGESTHPFMCELAKDTMATTGRRGWNRLRICHAKTIQSLSFASVSEVFTVDMPRGKTKNASPQLMMMLHAHEHNTNPSEMPARCCPCAVKRAYPRIKGRQHNTAPDTCRAVNNWTWHLAGNGQGLPMINSVG